MNYTLYKLDSMYGDLLSYIPEKSYLLQIDNNATSTSSNSGCYALACPIFAMTVEKDKPVTKRNDILIFRVGINEPTISKMVEDFNYGNYFLSTIKNLLLGEVYRYATKSDIDEISFKRPLKKSYFTETGYPGLELRLYVKFKINEEEK